MAAALNPDRPARAADPTAASPAAASLADAAPAADAVAYPAVEPVQHYFDAVYGDYDAAEYSHEHYFMFDDLINGNAAAASAATATDHPAA